MRSSTCGRAASRNFEARDLLIHAFAGEVIDRVKVEPLRRALEAELYAQLAKDLAEMDAA